MIEIPGELFQRIKSHGEQSYNEECCGALFGSYNDETKIIFDILEFENEKQENRQNRFLISSDQYKSAEKLAKEKGLELLGFYHSHPDHPAIPSQFDTDHALPWFLYIIVSVNKAKAGNLTAWVLKEDRSRFEEQDVSVRASLSGETLVKPDASARR
jgi:proteasome lid subunit RPN8/RPN11